MRFPFASLRSFAPFASAVWFRAFATLQRIALSRKLSPSDAPSSGLAAAERNVEHGIASKCVGRNHLEPAVGARYVYDHEADSRRTRKLLRKDLSRRRRYIGPGLIVELVEPAVAIDPARIRVRDVGEHRERPQRELRIDVDPLAGRGVAGVEVDEPPVLRRPVDW